MMETEYQLLASQKTEKELQVGKSQTSFCWDFFLWAVFIMEYLPSKRQAEVQFHK